MQDTPETPNRPASPLRRYRNWLLLALFGTVALFAFASYERRTKTPHVSQEEFLGNASCAQCHPKEFDLHKPSRHAMTMRPVDKKILGEQVLTPGPIPNTNMALYETPKGFLMGWQGSAEGAEPMQLALGSNRIAFTFVKVVDNQAVLELKQTYHWKTHTWHVTPGQPAEDTTHLGKLFNEYTSRKCLGCHSTTLPEATITPEPRFYGVGCEACHGPGKKHVEAVLAGNTQNLQMPNLRAMGGTKLNELCGACHRTLRDITPDQIDMTQRFPAYGLMKSRCYLESGNQLSCITCHDPHKDASVDPKQYEKACLNCHAPSSGSSKMSFGPAPPKQVSCPVNPKENCTACHMPKRQAGPEAMADHYIRVFKEGEQRIR